MGARKKEKRIAFAGFFRLFWEFRARKYFTDHHTPYTIHESVLACKTQDY